MGTRAVGIDRGSASGPNARQPPLRRVPPPMTADALLVRPLPPRLVIVVVVVAAPHAGSPPSLRICSKKKFPWPWTLLPWARGGPAAQSLAFFTGGKPASGLGGAHRLGHVGVRPEHITAAVEPLPLAEALAVRLLVALLGHVNVVPRLGVLGLAHVEVRLAAAAAAAAAALSTPAAAAAASAILVASATAAARNVRARRKGAAAKLLPAPRVWWWARTALPCRSAAAAACRRSSELPSSPPPT